MVVALLYSSARSPCPSVVSLLRFAKTYKVELRRYLENRGTGGEDQEAQAGDLQPTISNQPHLLILDQFEEIFTTYPERYTNRADFFRQLGDCLKAYPKLGLLISMREDYLADLDRYCAYLPDRLRCRFRLERLNEEAAVAAVKGPADREAGPIFAPGVAEALVDELRRLRPRSGELAHAHGGAGAMTPALGEYVEPILLQVVCRRLWQQLPQNPQSFKMADLQAFGSLTPC